jgi:hypothetical protein
MLKLKLGPIKTYKGAYPFLKSFLYSKNNQEKDLEGV